VTHIEHKGLGLSVELKDLKQRDLERFYAKRREVGLDPDVLSLPEYSGGLIRIAVELDFFSERFEIDDWEPAKTIILKNGLIGAILEAVKIPPE